MESANKSNHFIDPDDWRKFEKYLCETNRFILSNYWENFIKIVVKTAHKRTKILKKGTRLLRARIGTSWVEFEEGDEQPCPISPHEMGAPPKHLAKEGRLNSKGIPYLYLATKIETVVAEIKPLIGSEITIGCFEILDNLKIVDTSNDKPKFFLSQHFINWKEDNCDIKKRPIENYTPREKEEYIWGDINSAFSKPILPNDSPLKYLSTQYLAEKLKTNDYDGIGYRSSLCQDGYNIALFNPDKAKSVGCRMFKINQLKYEYEESGNPVSLSDDNKVLYQRVEIIGPADAKKHREKNN